MDQLPTELIYIVTYNLNYVDTMILCQSSKLFKWLCKSPIFWKNKLDKFIPGISSNLINKSVTDLKNLYQFWENGGFVQTINNNFLFLKKTAVQISASYYRTAIVTNNGQCQVINTYPNKVGNLISSQTLPLEKIIQVSCGLEHLACLTIDGEVYTLGSNSRGQLGINQEIALLPRKIPQLTNIIQVSCGNYHTAALTASGDVFTWGSNKYGHRESQPQQYNIPQRVDISKVVQISCGGHHTAFLTEEGELYFIGKNKYGQLGWGNFHPRSIPSKLLGHSNIVSVSCGRNHTAFINREGQVYVMGDNITGQLGIGYLSNGESIPQLIATSNFNASPIVQVSCGWYSSEFLAADGRLYHTSFNGESAIIVNVPLGNKTIISISCGFDAIFIGK